MRIPLFAQKGPLLRQIFVNWNQNRTSLVFHHDIPVYKKNQSNDPLKSYYIIECTDEQTDKQTTNIQGDSYKLPPKLRLQGIVK